MARVCEELFPVGSFAGQSVAGFHMDDILKNNLDILIKNIVRDWDFTIIISGGGETRVGKSRVAFQIACYWAYQMWKVHGIKVPFDLKLNCVFNGTELIEKGNYLGANHKYAPLLFDEAGADLEGRKVMHTVTQNVLDYFRECGQYNLLNILVIPEFFDLPKSIAISRSTLLIDVYTLHTKDDIIDRGHFKLYSPYNKKQLYRLGKRELDYKAWGADWGRGAFGNLFPLDLEEYKKMKMEALKKREKQKKNRFIIMRDGMFYLYHKATGKKGIEIEKEMKKLTGLKLDEDMIEKIIAFYIKKENSSEIEEEEEESDDGDKG